MMCDRKPYNLYCLVAQLCAASKIVGRFPGAAVRLCPTAGSSFWAQSLSSFQQASLSNFWNLELLNSHLFL